MFTRGAFEKVLATAAGQYSTSSSVSCFTKQKHSANRPITLAELPSKT
jgi:hypothetical protein